MFGYSLVRRVKRWWQGRILRKARIPEPLWERVIADVPLLERLPAKDKHRLRELSSLFLHRKAIVGAGDFQLDDYMRAVIAAQACLLILNLDLDYFDGWVEVIVYPEPFFVPQRRVDEAGVVQESTWTLGGEAWGRGPVILSWADVRPPHHAHHNHGVNVVLHEFAHKLDLLNGAANGMPPLHKAMPREGWTADFTHAYNDMLHHVEGGHKGRIDPYALESPAEFFAVVTEFFFERPKVLQQALPAVYSQLEQFYRQRPLQRQ